ncbi:cytochrome P450 [Streptosporangium amethystogenes]|uniref:cytochrome P450 n=1 Tax=Streptosporangium amethystogenes TaxID=2002 RepID=UPI0037BD7FEC
MPFSCPNPFEEPPEFARIRAHDGLARMRTSTGGTGWLVSRYADVKALCADRRIGRSHPAPDHAPRLWDAPLFAPVGGPATEMSNHRAWRRVIAPAFRPGRVASAGARARFTLDRLLDDLAAHGGPVDLCSMLAVPYATQMVFEFVGVSEESSAFCRERSGWLREGGDTSRGDSAVHQVHMSLMVERDGDDVAGRLARLTAEEAAGLLRTFDITEYETIAARIGYGLLFLLAHPEQRRRLEREPALVVTAVEEIMRLAVPGGSWVPRYALDDIAFGDSRIRTGDLVVFALQSANRDERQFRDPDVFAVDRSPNPHLGFGHGKFYCLGAHLSRLLLRTVLSTVFDRFPGIRLDVPVEQIEINRRSVTGGLRGLPVTW